MVANATWEIFVYIILFYDQLLINFYLFIQTNISFSVFNTSRNIITSFIFMIKAQYLLLFIFIVIKSGLGSIYNHKQVTKNLKRLLNVENRSKGLLHEKSNGFFFRLAEPESETHIFELFY